MNSLSHVRFFTTPWTAAHQAPPSMGFSRQEYWSGVPSPSPSAGGHKHLVGSTFLYDHSSKGTWASQVTLMVKNPPANAGDVRTVGSIPGLGRPSGGGHSNLLQHPCLENPHGQRSLAGYCPCGHKESDTIEGLSTTHTEQPGSFRVHHCVKSVVSKAVQSR